MCAYYNYLLKVEWVHKNYDVKTLEAKEEFN